MIAIKTAVGPGPGVASVGVVFGEFERVASAQATMTGGFLCRIAITGATVTVTPMRFDYPATVIGPAVDVAGAIDLRAQTITVIADGY